ncbi:hypothetical protein GUITHDRAFT_153044 [Guillardia theta CCMP2712]|uniref:Uncharacterized protein n=1 Tax=Guillardia theta (strain CCMP2712) TaxID=905079 RepID=L1J6U6_GUITC|nr:hypothetical protein GUITHDRAFT_153043 [Guillardia theta CCMP2712]XP_005831052.1 hypothetical protein GUITHDRAFT_153044 [Guillardia theta CCMP2712]EKX44071.1 hypothetical protein GUITHDRAFT_153043 [Guillardia theta CCMP2712]EKX44072.1 hypothetical protein GUITHDRAFT_153044 [Guillardia theta CCMP2712]|eukprot:XP_005831051.1 hypothetical protein GUITHDRAFT_153043 [Guillardia theta CCMP2712]
MWHRCSRSLRRLSVHASPRAAPKPLSLLAGVSADHQPSPPRPHRLLHCSSLSLLPSRMYARQLEDFEEQQVACRSPSCVTCMMCSLGSIRRPAIDQGGRLEEGGLLGAVKRAGSGLGPSIDRAGNFVMEGDRARCKSAP